MTLTATIAQKDAAKMDLIAAQYDPRFNEHYDYTDVANLAAIQAVEEYARAYAEDDRFSLAVAERIAMKGKNGYEKGVLVDSPWGDNQVIDVEIDANGKVTTCIKEITVNPGFMLSLQRHLGRDELWEVLEGTLTVIKNGELIEVKAGDSITLEAGDVHCMNNKHDQPVKVKETQTGICAEADNVRLVDFSNRGVYPLSNEIEYKSAKIYAQLQMDILNKFGPMAIVKGEDTKVRFEPPQQLLAA